MENISYKKEFENIKMHTKTLVAPGIIGETILYKNYKKSNAERKPKKILPLFEDILEKTNIYGIYRSYKYYIYL